MKQIPTDDMPYLTWEKELLLSVRRCGRDRFSGSGNRACPREPSPWEMLAGPARPNKRRKR